LAISLNITDILYHGKAVVSRGFTKSFKRKKAEISEEIGKNRGKNIGGRDAF
jgi:hypothetical protein